MTMRHRLAWLAMLLYLAPAGAADYLRDRQEVTALLTGTTFQGTYLRTQSPYALHFNSDGSLRNQLGEQGSWWVNESGQYCRKWTSGRMQGHEACLDLAREGDQITIYSNSKKVATGKLAPK